MSAAHNHSLLNWAGPTFHSAGFYNLPPCWKYSSRNLLHMCILHDGLSQSELYMLIFYVRSLPPSYLSWVMAAKGQYFPIRVSQFLILLHSAVGLSGISQYERHRYKYSLKLNDVWIVFNSFSFRVLVSLKPDHCHTVKAYLDTQMLFVTPVFCLKSLQWDRFIAQSLTDQLI